MDWKPFAAALADRAIPTASRWRAPVAEVPRHLFVPRWWEQDDYRWELRRGDTDTEDWPAAAYKDRSLVTSVGALHADHADPLEFPEGLPTSSSTLPSLLVKMFQHARIGDEHQLLDVGTGSGYGTALACMRLGDSRVTSIDVDQYLSSAARQRLDEVGLHPEVLTVDATSEVPGGFDRIVSTFGVRPVPASWLSALKPGGRLVTTIAGTSLIVTAEKQDDGSARGRVEWDRASFMQTRHGAVYPTQPGDLLSAAHEQDGDTVTIGPYPPVNVEDAWDLSSMLSITVPGVVWGYETQGDNYHITYLAHPDGSWARARGCGTERPVVHQSGEQRLWDALDQVRRYWLENGELPVRGARVLITPDGETRLARGGWRAAL